MCIYLVSVKTFFGWLINIVIYFQRNTIHVTFVEELMERLRLLIDVQEIKDWLYVEFSNRFISREILLIYNIIIEIHYNFIHPTKEMDHIRRYRNKNMFIMLLRYIHTTTLELL